jgi:hypothetical protein
MIISMMIMVDIKCKGDGNYSPDEEDREIPLSSGTSFMSN